MKLIASISLFLFYHFAFGQVLYFPKDFKNKLDTINNKEVLPQGLLQGKSAVIYFVPQKEFTNIASEVQKGLNKSGIDAVTHLHVNNVFSGTESIDAYRENLINREIDYLIYYYADPIPKINIFKFKKSFIPDSTFTLQNEKLQELLRQLYLQAARSNQELTNNLILEVPAYMDYPKFITGRRAEFYDLNMKSGKLAIPKMKDSLLNKEFDSIMNAYYPFKYGFVEPGMKEEELRKEGYWFILYGIQGSGSLVRNLLEYTTTKEETAYASVVANNGKTEVKTFSVDTPVTKFYIKDTRNGDVFLGKHYDADITWQAALKNYIINLKNILAP